MASQMVVPASKDTLFMRGFSARLRVDDIRDFFVESGGECSVEFFKEAEGDEKLYIALRFDTKDIAKDILNRYNNSTVLGDKISISWFKDLRRARARAWRGGHSTWGPGPAARRRGWSPQRSGEYRSNWNYSPPRHGHSNYNWRDRGRGRSPVGTRVRKFDRSSSRSPSHSRSRSHSRSYSRSRSRSSSHSPRRSSHRRRSRSLSEPRDSRDAGRRSRSSSKTPHEQRGKTDIHRKSSDHVDDRDDDWRQVKNHSPVRSVSRDKYPDHSQEVTRSREEDAEQRSYDGTPPRLNKQLRSTVVSVDLPSRKDEMDDDDHDYKDKNMRDRKEDSKYYDGNERNSTDRKYIPDKMSPGHPGRERYTRDEYYSRDREDKRAHSPELDRANKEIADPDSPPYTKEAAGDIRRNNIDREEGEVASQSSRMSRDLASRHSLDVDYSPDTNDRRKRIHDGDDRSTTYTTKHDDDIADIKRRKHEELPISKEHRRDGYDERTSKVHYRDEEDILRDQSPVDEERCKTAVTVNGGLARELEKGIPVLSQDKMATVREKKDDIERAYRQDCETFAGVVKMLVSKDPALETKIQLSLRENLKEIGQRCIYELREFIDRVKSQEEPAR